MSYYIIQQNIRRKKSFQCLSWNYLNLLYHKQLFWIQKTVVFCLSRKKLNFEF